MATRKTAKRTATRKTLPAGSRLRDWRVEAMERMRELILAAESGIVEDQKWKKPSNPGGVPVWSKHGIICTGETYKTYLKFTFMKGGALPDPARLFTAGTGVRRAIDLREGEKLDPRAFKALVRAAISLNLAGAARS